MRIALLHSFYGSAQPSGENAVVRDQLAALQSAGHDVRLVARHTDDVQSKRLYAVRSALTAATGRGPHAEAELAAFAPDVVHVHNTFPNWGTAWLRDWAPRTVVTIHNFRPLCAAATLFRDGAACQDCLRTPVLPAVRHACYRGSRAATVPVALATRPGGPLRALLRDAAAVTVLNDAAKEVYDRSLRRQVRVVPNFVDDATTPLSGAGPAGWVYVGRFTPEKGVLDLVETWPAGELLDIVGSGPDLEAVRAAAAAREGVTVLQQLDRADLRRRLGGYEGLVLPSLWAEGLPTVVLEAIAAGTPAVVSSAVAASASLAGRGVAVPYVPAAGAAGLAQALSAVRAGGDVMRAQAHAVHASTYSRAAWLQAITAVYDDVAGGSARG